MFYLVGLGCIGRFDCFECLWQEGDSENDQQYKYCFTLDLEHILIGRFSRDSQCFSEFHWMCKC